MNGEEEPQGRTEPVRKCQITEVPEALLRVLPRLPLAGGWVQAIGGGAWAGRAEVGAGRDA